MKQLVQFFLMDTVVAVVMIMLWMYLLHIPQYGNVQLAICYTILHSLFLSALTYSIKQEESEFSEGTKWLCVVLNRYIAGPEVLTNLVVGTRAQDYPNGHWITLGVVVLQITPTFYLLWRMSREYQYGLEAEV